MSNSLLWKYTIVIFPCLLQGSKQLYRVVVHPYLLKYEDEIDENLTQVYMYFYGLCIKNIYSLDWSVIIQSSPAILTSWD